MKNPSAYVRGIASATTFAAALALVACTSFPATPPKVLAAKIQNAKTSADHEEIATLYERDAQAASGLAQEHRELGQSYSKVYTRGSGLQMARHCEAVAAQYTAIANDMKALAKAHRDMATQGPQ